ncbi:DUF4179 domain-containing protein [Psychrobacillus sp. FJAT-21963]|uniref:DUF4179 domain-containing protein n=1 Tax=Psychrobacillus sp. FJAT-21963 TaxID=1712028 RepID=UPI0006FC023B|nr:DUF4179 domain-containing protein [Psychrobacillus sp. FJAT-21963]KQL37044.1 hypothetical protein AN959_03060 [Psychrobacillus sp. FJAT-21963]
MYEKEEEMLIQSKQRLEQIEIPEQRVNDAIQEGIEKAKNKKRYRRKTITMLSVVAILMLTLVTSIRVSPAFANAVSSIPGMERFVHLIQFDKGLEAIMENDYYEPIGVSQIKDNMTFTIDGVIIDETGAEIFYTLEAPHSIEKINYTKIDLLNDDRSLIGSIGYDSPNQEHANRKEDKFSFVFTETEKFTSNEFEITFQVEMDSKNTTFQVPFTIKNEWKNGKVYSLNEEVEMDGQKISVKEIKVYPLRVAVSIAFDEQNDMEILQFEDMRIEDENGEVWSSIQNGTSGFGGVGNKERTYFLQSNYFKEPKELYFKFDKVQALPKDESYFLIDFGKKEVLKQPSEGKIEVTGIHSNSFEVKYAPIRENHMYSLFTDGENALGEVVDIPTQGTSGDGEYHFSEITLEAKDVINPVRLDFTAYPNYLDGSVSIKIK